ncbi:MAG TPA: sugar phosphate nucleotidyltransferase [Longimicrobiales bacterium]|nr:sugar phosphate nucleotidyltransferase [Longimicrobiales bacterium]
MEAIILAAGYGTRLRPLTDHVPKALVEVDGVPVLERVARRLVDAGAHRLVINTHHLGEQIEAFVRARDGFGVDVRFSRETGEAPLETGGGVQQAARLMELREPFLVHNVDVVSDLDIRDLHDTHHPAALATLAVGPPETRSPLLLDDRGVVGVRYPSGGESLAREPVGGIRAAAFCGVSVVSHTLPSLMRETGAFSVIPVYLRLIAAGALVAAWDIGASYWSDIGTHERLKETSRVLAEARAAAGEGRRARSAPAEDRQGQGE